MGIFFCEELKACPVHDGGKLKINSFTVTPESGPVGTTFEMDVAFTVYNQTSTGEMVIDIQPTADQPFGDGELDEGFAPGQYQVKFQLQVSPASLSLSRLVCTTPSSFCATVSAGPPS